jgi:CRISPR-associated endonuclease/helicase Cas3
LFELLAKSGLDGVRHLTTAMTAAHRQHVLAEIRNDLKDGRPVRLVSTSLIEAGVDVSFNTVWRAWAGLDQMAQAAGRCNRNGEHGHEGGLLTIFQREEIEGRNPPPERPGRRWSAMTPWRASSRRTSHRKPDHAL